MKIVQLASVESEALFTAGMISYTGQFTGRTVLGIIMLIQHLSYADFVKCAREPGDRLFTAYMFTLFPIG